MSNNIFDQNPKGMTEKLQKACIGIAGCGGLGSNAAVSLCRAGVGRLILADYDKVEPSNLNRQYFFESDIGSSKTEALGNHLININENIRTEIFSGRVTSDNVTDIFGKADILIEAFDAVESKMLLIDKWCKCLPGKPIICGTGIAGWGNTEALKITKAGNIYFCGDQVTEAEIGLCAPRVAIVANMQANLAIELIMKS